MLFRVDAGVGLGAERKTAIDAKGPALAGGAGASVEGAVPWLSFGGGIRLDRSRATLVSKGGSGCLRADPTTCYSFPGGLTHEVQAIETGLYLKPYYMRGPARMWLRAGGQAAFVEWAYAEGSAAHATGSTTAFGPSVGAGFDWAFAARRSAVSASIIAGGPLYVEESDDLLGRPWKSSGNPSSSPIRISISYATVLGKTK